MLVREVKPEDMNRWLELAAEVEAVFQGSMINSQEFYNYMEAKIKKKEALMATDRNNDNALLGIIGFSRTSNSITWFAVFEKYRNKGVGEKLLACALNQLDRAKEITVTTFRDGYELGAPARGVYHKFGFVDFDNTIYDDQGNPRYLMKLLPDSTIKQGQSFHYTYKRYMEWADKEYCPVCSHQAGPSDIVLIKELQHSWLKASMHAQGCLWGKCHVLCKKHFVELHDMPEQDLLDFMKDVQRASKALKKVSGAVKINYEIHGNTVPHLHVHLFPRYMNDQFPSAPIDYRITEPNVYGSERGFRHFIESMKLELEKL